MRSEYHEGLNRDQVVQISRLSSGESFVDRRKEQTSEFRGRLGGSVVHLRFHLDSSDLYVRTISSYRST